MCMDFMDSGNFNGLIFEDREISVFWNVRIGLKRYQLFEVRIRGNDIGRMCVCEGNFERCKNNCWNKLLRENKMQFPGTNHTLGVLKMGQKY